MILTNNFPVNPIQSHWGLSFIINLGDWHLLSDEACDAAEEIN